MDGDLRVALAEDHYLVREGTRRALDQADGIEVIAAVGTAVELELVVEREVPDVVVTDIRMPPGHQTEGIDAAHRIRAAHPDIGVVVLSQYAEGEYAIDFLREGTAGRAYLLKEQIGDPGQLAAAVRTVARGGSWIDPQVVAALVAQTTRRRSSPLRRLTDRELQVLEQMAQGRTNTSIAATMNLSRSSIEKYSTTLFQKLGLGDEPQVHRRVTAVLTFLHEQGRARPLSRGDP